ncbi:MAG: O-methyltransferase [Desulfatibacillaceae bacterium]
MSKMLEDAEAVFSELVPDRDELLLALEREAGEEGIPIAGPLVGHLLYILVRATGARKILELGTATGYSAVFLGRAAAEHGGRVVTVERDPDMAARAGHNLLEAGLAGRVEIVTGEADDLLPRMEPGFDMAFLDIDKEGYAPALLHCARLVRGGGLLVADNTAFSAAEDFSRAVAGTENWHAVNLHCFLPGHSPEYDGLCIALRTP